MSSGTDRTAVAAPIDLAYRKISHALAAFDWTIGPSGRPTGTAFVKQEDYDALLAGIDDLRRAALEAGPPPPEPSPEAIDAYWRAWATTPRPSDDGDTQEAHLAGLRAAYATDFGKSNDKAT